MVVFDDTIFHLQRAGGISRYWANLIAGSRATGLRSTVVGRPNNNVFGSSIVPDHVLSRRLPWSVERYLPVPLSRSDERRLFHSSYYRVSSGDRAVKLLVTVHDFVYERYVSGPTKMVHSAQKRLAVRNATGVICVSESTKRDLEFFFPGEIAGKPVWVIPNGVSNEFYPLSFSEARALTSAFLVPENFLLFVGDRSGYKNFRSIPGILRRQEHLNLVIVGGGPLTESESLDLADCSERVHYVGRVTNTELNALYNLAFCLVYPSKYEGFGIPLLEAMAAGCPAVAVRASSIPEVVGDAAILVDEPSEVELTAAVQTLEDPNKRTVIIELGKQRASQFSWDRTVRETTNVYAELLGSW